jgi:V-type H+-transporting ATPase subunit H
MSTSSSPPFTIKSPVIAAFPLIPWDTLASLQLTAQETALLRMADTNTTDYTLADARDASMYARVLLKVIAASSTSATGALEGTTDATSAVQTDPMSVVCHYALTKLIDVVTTLSTTTTAVTVATVFYVGKDGVLVDPWKALLRCLNRGGKGDAFVQKAASWCLTKILVAACPSQRGNSGNSNSNINKRPVQYASALEPLEAVTAWIASQLKNGSCVSACAPALRVLMEAPETRRLFCKSGGVRYMARPMKKKSDAPSSSSSSSSSNKKKQLGQASAQQLYELVFCMWIITYDVTASFATRQEFARDNGAAVSALCDLVAMAPREKVVRVALSALRNLATCSSQQDPGPAGQLPVVDGTFFLNEMIACGLIKAIDLLRDRQFADPDLMDDVDFLYKQLHENYKEMTRWEVYKNEVESGHLQWGSVHTEAFFKENARMIEGSDGDFHLLKVLIALLSSKDEEVAAIACYDVGEFVRHYPNGRAIVKRLGAKELVMQLIEHENPELQRHALQCVSKIMVQNWEYVK